MAYELLVPSNDIRIASGMVPALFEPTEAGSLTWRWISYIADIFSEL
jgi:hypothetical protein